MVIIKTGVFKKAEDWKGGMDEFLNVGDHVCEDIVNHFINVLPPATMRSHLIQIGEPYFHIGDKELYPTIVKIDGEWVFAGNCFHEQSDTVLLTHDMNQLKTGYVTVFAENLSGSLTHETESFYDQEQGIISVNIPQEFEIIAFQQKAELFNKSSNAESVGYDTKFTFEENPEMYAAEYLARHFTEGLNREDESVMYDVLDLIEYHDSLENILLGLECPISQAYFYESMVSEINWCKETLASEVDEGTATHQQVSVLKKAYEIAVNYMQEMSSLN